MIANILITLEAFGKIALIFGLGVGLIVLAFEIYDRVTDDGFDNHWRTTVRDER